MAHFWAKTTSEDKPGISVYQHMVNVGCVARCIAESSPEILQRFNLQSSIVGALAALHDLGKISPGFQRKCPAWIKENNLEKIARNNCWDTAMEPYHGQVSHAAIQSFLIDKGIDRKTSKFVSAVLGAHHGYLAQPNDRGFRPKGAISETHSGIDWDAERAMNAQKIWDYFVAPSFSSCTDESPALWWIAGLTSVADWIGSDERFFSPERSVKDGDISSKAWGALDAIGFRQIEFIPNLSFHDLFHDSKNPEIKWVPNEMQEKALAAINKPGVYVIEAPMGMGKTEAALWSAYQLLLAKKANGIYFALPTQMTSNRIHIRMNDFLRRIAPDIPSSHLIHGNSWLMEMDFGIHPSVTDKNEKTCDDARAARAWFASTKRGLIARFGVGTIDQALLGVVAAKHFFVRHFALAGKVVILDEIHSYDLYTGTLIDKLITTLEELGCTVIILSATLTEKRRRKMLSCSDEDIKESDISYPLITGRTEDTPIRHVSVTPPQDKSIKVDFVDASKAVEEAIQCAQNGGAVLWICNTVDNAQQCYRSFKEATNDQFPLGLLHSRFPFWRREQLENEWMERLGKEGKTRCGSILVSTQIVEQSVDLDADLLITELAPTDMILQRLGRLWRHERNNRPVNLPKLYILEEEKSLDDFRNMEAKSIEKSLGGKAKVYAPYVLLRSLEIWKDNSHILIPSQIRALIEATYVERENEPLSWQQLSDNWFGTDSAKKMCAARNSNLWQVALEDEEGVQTRINEMSTVSVVLCKSLDKRNALFIDETSHGLGDEFSLALAQSIHKNLVKVPKYLFEGVDSCSAFEGYLHGAQTVGLVDADGRINVKGLKTGKQLRYTDDLGLVIEKS